MSRCLGSTSLTGWPSMEIVPDVTSSRPATIRSAVVLPHPEGPTSTSSSPSPTERSSESTATVPSGKRLVTDSSSIRDNLPPHAQRQALDQVPLEDQVHDDRRDRADDRARHESGSAASSPGRQGGQADGDRPLVRGQEQQAYQQVIPDLDELENGHGRD